MQTEKHPLEPFLPENAKILMLGSFPPPKSRWSMDFFYPNWINDMWRILGSLFFGDKHHFELQGRKQFHKKAIAEFCIEKGIALYDTASEVRRLKENASDKFLEVVTPTDIETLLAKIPHCRAIVTTGQKATDTIVLTLGCKEPAIGSYETTKINGQEIRFWRMPSSSRAYPLPLEKKAEFYRAMLTDEGIL